jgi:phosphohistidine phosphatase
MLYLIRHAHASNGVPDEARPLSASGRDQVRRLADFIRNGGAWRERPAEIWHSPLVRARETAEQLAEAFGMQAALRETGGLRPEDDPEGIVERTEAFRGHLALVGHEPFMSLLATRLTAGRFQSPIFFFNKGTALALERIHPEAGSPWIACWQADPEVLA